MMGGLITRSLAVILDFLYMNLCIVMHSFGHSDHTLNETIQSLEYPNM